LRWVGLGVLGAVAVMRCRVKVHRGWLLGTCSVFGRGGIACVHPFVLAGLLMERLVWQ